MATSDADLPKDAISFRDALAFFWGARFCMIGGFISGLVMATLLLIWVKPAFEASVSLAPPNISLPGTTFRGGGSGDGTNLTSLLGLKGADDGPSPYERVMLTIQSRDLADGLSRDPRIIHTIFRGDWDASSQQWMHRWSLSNMFGDIVSAMFGRGGWAPPGADELQGYIQATVVVKPADQHSVTSITYRNQDADFARYFLNKLVLSADRAIRDTDRRRYQQYQAFLAEQINRGSSVELRQSLIAMYGSVTQQLMLVTSDATYGIDIMDGPNVSRRPVSPSPPRVYLILGMLGIAGGLAAAVGRACGFIPTWMFSLKEWRRRS